MSVVTCPNCGAKNRVDEHRAASMRPKCGRCGAELSVPAGTTAAATDKPMELTDARFDSVVLSPRGTPVLVDCWAAWCGPCRMVAPVLDQLAAESRGRYLITKLDVDANPAVAQRYQISSIPTMLLFKDGQLVDRLVGVQPKQALADRLAQLAR